MENYLLLAVVVVLGAFMIFNMRKRNKQMKADQEKKARETVPGAKVLLQGGLYGTIVSFDPDNLDEPARVEIAPGVVIEVHSQAVLRIVDPAESADVDGLDDDINLDDVTVEDITGVAPSSDSPVLETPEQTRARLEGDSGEKR